MTTLKLLHSTVSLHLERGGPAITVPALCGGLAKRGHAVTLVAGRWSDAPVAAAPDGVELLLFPGQALGKAVRSPQMRAWLRANAAGFDMVHYHGLWRFTERYAAAAARRAGVPYVVSPRGMLEPWALRRSRLVKALLWSVFQRRDLAHAACLHATSWMERDAIRNALRHCPPVACIPNGIAMACSVPPQEAQPRPGADKRYALFLSRLHPKKGLANLLHAWRRIRPQHPEWSLVVAGPDEGNHRAEMEQLAARLGIADNVRFAGPVYGAEKAALMRRAAVFVLPTHSENFGVVVAESLACGTPVITTKGTPWRELEERHCGWWIEVGVEPLVRALEQATAMPEPQLREMGVRGQALVAERYTWEGVAAGMSAVYEWLAHGGTQPECVEG